VDKAKRRRRASSAVFSAKLAGLHNVWGTLLQHMGAMCSRIPGYAHPLPRLCVSAEHH
jgi:hypothetical protein